MKPGSQMVKSAQRTVAVWSQSQMYRDYEQAFTQGTGLPLRLQVPTVLNVGHYAKTQENPFCALMSKSDESCAEGLAQCYALQCRIEAAAQHLPKTLKCFAGLCETAVPVRVENDLIAFLHTGQVLLQRPDRTTFKHIAQALLKRGAEIDFKKLEEYYFNTRVLSLSQYEALIQLLVIFASQLAECSAVAAPEDTRMESPAIAKAQTYIRDHSESKLSLDSVAHAVNMSATYFSEKFKEFTEINFVDYVARTRIENARHLLVSPKRRVSEVAFEVGFQSLSQFNRAFRRISGESPRDYRARLPRARNEQ